MVHWGSGFQNRYNGLLVLGLIVLSVFCGVPNWAQAPDKPLDSQRHDVVVDKKINPHVGKPADTADKSDDRQMDVYGVVLKVRNIQRSSLGGHWFSPLTPPGQTTHETVQKVTVRLDISEPIAGVQGNVIEAENMLGENPAYNIPLKPGARILLNMEKNPLTNQWTFSITNRDRTPAIMMLGALTIMALLLIGGVEVAKHMLLVSLILWGCYQWLFPAVTTSRTGLLWILAMCFGFTILGSLIYRSSEEHRRFSKAQVVVILSTLGGLAIMALIMGIMHWITPLDGYTSEDLAALWYRFPKMDYWALLMATVLLGYQGFIFYLCWMLSQNRKSTNGEAEEVLGFGQRFGIVMMRGRRLLGPMISSIGLLFLGLYLPILLQLQGTSTAQFMNLESTASMLSIAFAGGLALVLTVPLTALISSIIYSLPERKS